jgi:hypothetical protein
MYLALQTQYEGKGHNLKRQQILQLSEIKSNEYRDTTTFIIAWRVILTKLAQMNFIASADDDSSDSDGHFIMATKSKNTM